LHYLERGAGEPVVLIHGLGSSGADWAFQVPALEAEYRVLLPDLPGCGYSAGLAAGYTIADLAAALWRWLDDLGIERPNLVGFSMGGAVGLEMALQRPAAVARLALINSLASYRVDHWTKWCKARIDAGLVRLLGIERTARVIAARLFPESHQAAMRDRAERVIGSVPASTYLDMARVLERWSAYERLERLACRALLIAAEFDYTPLAEKLDLAASLRADCVVVRESRHGTPFDAIGITNAALRAFLRDLPPPDPARWRRDDPALGLPISLVNSVADEHAAVAAGRALPGPPGIVAASDSAGAKDCADLDEVGSRS
jgi:pimeloyl-ACP methyl ester carboxylesterase